MGHPADSSAALRNDNRLLRNDKQLNRQRQGPIRRFWLRQKDGSLGERMTTCGLGAAHLLCNLALLFPC